MKPFWKKSTEALEKGSRVIDVREALKSAQQERATLEEKHRGMFEQKNVIFAKGGPDALRKHLDDTRQLEDELIIIETAIDALKSRLDEAEKTESAEALESDAKAALANKALVEVRRANFFILIEELASLMKEASEATLNLKQFAAKAAAGGRKDLIVRDTFMSGYNEAVKRPAPINDPMFNQVLAQELEHILTFRKLGEKCGVKF